MKLQNKVMLALVMLVLLGFMILPGQDICLGLAGPCDFKGQKDRNKMN